MKKSFIALLLALMFCVIGRPAFAADEPIHLSFTSLYTDRHDIVKLVYKPWIEEVKKQSNGRLLIDYYNPNTLCPDVEAMDSCLRGQVSIVSALASRNPGRLPLNAILHSVALRSPGSRAGTATYQELINTYPEFKEELKGIKLLWAHTSAAGQFHAQKFPVNTKADIKGKKIIASTSEGVRLLKSFDVNAIMVPNMDIYLSLSRGMAEGVFYPVAPLRSYKLDESTKYHSMVNLYVSPIWAGISEEVFNGLPKDLQDVLLKTSAGMSEKCAITVDALDATEIKLLTEQGHVFNTVTPEELATWKPLADKVNKEFFLQEMAQRGNKNVDAEKLLEAATKISEKNAEAAKK